MNLGSLATIAGADPPNLYHFLFSHGMHEVNGMHPIHSRDKLDLAATLTVAGIATLPTAPRPVVWVPRLIAYLHRWGRRCCR